MTKTVMAKGVLGDEYEAQVDKLKWRPSVYAVVIDGDKILLSPQFKKGYDLPGGGVDLGEDLETAVVREVKEETGFDVIVKKLLAAKTSFFAPTHDHDFDGECYQSVMIYYLCEKVGGEVSTEGFDEHEQQYADLAEWLPVSEIDAINPMSTVDFRPIIKQALKGAK